MLQFFQAVNKTLFRNDDEGEETSEESDSNSADERLTSDEEEQDNEEVPSGVRTNKEQEVENEDSEWSGYSGTDNEEITSDLSEERELDDLEDEPGGLYYCSKL